MGGYYDCKKRSWRRYAPPVGLQLSLLLLIGQTSNQPLVSSPPRQKKDRVRTWTQVKVRLATQIADMQLTPEQTLYANVLVQAMADYASDDMALRRDARVWLNSRSEEECSFRWIVRVVFRIDDYKKIRKGIEEWKRKAKQK